MLKASIKEHSPEKIYDFLLKNFGPLMVLIRGNDVIINFNSKSHYKKALAQKIILLQGTLLQLFIYPQQNHQKEIINKTQLRQEIVPEPIRSITNIAKEFQQISSNLKLNRKEHQLQKIVKQQCKNMADIIISYDQFIRTAEDKMKLWPNNTRQDNKNQLVKLTQRRLKQITKQLKKGLTHLNKDLKEFGDQKPKQINLEPKWQYNQISQQNYQCQSFKLNLQYINDSFIRKLYSYNQNEFIGISKFKIDKRYNRIKLFNINKYKQVGNMNIGQGCRSLLFFNNYIICGTYQGYFSFFDKDKPQFQQLSPRMFGSFGNLSTITDIKLNKSRSSTSNILALSKNTIKSFNLDEIEIFSGTKSLIFQERLNIQHEKNIENFQILQLDKIIIGCSDYFQTYNLNAMKKGTPIKTPKKIIKILKINQNISYILQDSYISMIDFRSSNKNTINYHYQYSFSTLNSLNQNLLVYGTINGEMGLFDRRKERNIQWKTSVEHFKNGIVDILKHKKNLITVDSIGQIINWKPLQVS